MQRHIKQHGWSKCLEATLEREPRNELNSLAQLMVTETLAFTFNYKHGDNKKHLRPRKDQEALCFLCAASSIESTAKLESDRSLIVPRSVLLVPTCMSSNHSKTDSSRRKIGSRENRRRAGP